MATPSEQPDSQPSRRQQILSGLREQNEPAEFEGRKGFWVQPDCLFIEADSPQAAIAKYGKDGAVAHSHNHFCGSILHAKAQEELSTLSRQRDALKAALESISARLLFASWLESVSGKARTEIKSIADDISTLAQLSTQGGDEPCETTNERTVSSNGAENVPLVSCAEAQPSTQEAVERFTI